MQTERDDWESHWRDFYDASQINPAGAYRLRIVLRWLRRRLTPGSRLLDIGSGAGDLASEASRRFPDAAVRGIELSATGVAIAQARMQSAQFFQHDLLDAVTAPDAWADWADVAVCSEVLEHLDRPDALLANAAGFLSPGCQMLVTVPSGPMSAFDRFIGHRRHYSCGDLQNLLEAAGFQVERCTARGFPFFNLYRLMIITRGRKLVEDAAQGRSTNTAPARIVGAVFDALLRINLPAKRWGWQLVAETRFVP
jgi:cyclopropane fatty-acyl-phospholipid synthase-like methyltransferase